jgi:general secretion pathway protein D
MYSTMGTLRRLGPTVSVLVIAALLAGCAASRSFGRANTAARAGEWDVAIEEYRRALTSDPDNPEYRLALQRALGSASVHYTEQGRIAEARGQLEEALRAYRRANEFDPSNRQLASKVSQLERQMRAEFEKAQPTPTIDQMREVARQNLTPALVGMNEVLPLLSFVNASVRDILTFIGKQAGGINVTFESGYADPRPYTIEMDGVTLEQALNQITTANQLFYKVLNPRTILVVNDTPQKRAAYDEQVIKVLRLSHADATEVQAMLQQVVRIPAAAQQTQFAISANKTQNSITIRATQNVAQIIERVVEIVDTPRAEVVVEVEILEVRKSRLKEYGLDLGNYTIGAVYSPETDPRTTSGLTSPPFNLNSIANGVNRGDFYLAVPAAAIRFLENDSQTKLLAKTQLRGAEGQKLTLNLGEEVPVPTTVFTPIAQGGANLNPLSSFNYRTVGIVLEATPRVTYEEEIVLDVIVESSTRSQDVNIGGSNLPTFSTRKVQGMMRLRDGEPNLLAGLIQENERRSLTGFPGLLRLPIIKQLFSANESTIDQTDIIVLMTPRIIRSHELTQDDINALFIGSSQNLGIGGPPPLIAPPPVQGLPPAGGAAVPGAAPPAGAPGAPGGAAVPGPAAAPAPDGQPGAAVTPNTAPPAAVAPPATTPFPGVPAPVTTAPRDATATSQTGATPPALSPTGATPGAQIVMSPGATEFRVGSNGYPVVISAANASRLSSLSLTLTYNPAALRVRSVQQGTFMSSAGTAVAFTEDHANPGRVDVVMMRTGDSTGASGSGLLSSIIFDAIGPGPANLVITGTATAPGGGALPLQFAPAPSVIVR